MRVIYVKNKDLFYKVSKDLRIIERIKNIKEKDEIEGVEDIWNIVYYYYKKNNTYIYFPTNIKIKEFVKNLKDIDKMIKNYKDKNKITDKIDKYILYIKNNKYSETDIINNAKSLISPQYIETIYPIIIDLNNNCVMVYKKRDKEEMEITKRKIRVVIGCKWDVKGSFDDCITYIYYLHPGQLKIEDKIF